MLNFLIAFENICAFSDSDFNDEDAQHYSRNLGTGGGTGRGTGSLHESRQPSLRASAEGAFRGPSPNMQSLGRESRASGGKSVSIKSRSREFPVAVQSNSPLHHTRGQNSYSVQDSVGFQSLIQNVRLLLNSLLLFNRLTCMNANPRTT